MRRIRRQDFLLQICLRTPGNDHRLQSAVRSLQTCNRPLSSSSEAARRACTAVSVLSFSPFAWCPPVQVKHLSRYVSLMRYSGYRSPTSRSQRKHGRRVPYKRGYFLDVRTLAAALFSRSFSLASLAEFLNVSRKHQTEQHGKSVDYLEYARQDVATTGSASSSSALVTRRWTSTRPSIAYSARQVSAKPISTRWASNHGSRCSRMYRARF